MKSVVYGNIYIYITNSNPYFVLKFSFEQSKQCIDRKHIIIVQIFLLSKLFYNLTFLRQIKIIESFFTDNCVKALDCVCLNVMSDQPARLLAASALTDDASLFS